MGAKIAKNRKKQVAPLGPNFNESFSKRQVDPNMNPPMEPNRNLQMQHYRGPQEDTYYSNDRIDPYANRQINQTEKTKKKAFCCSKKKKVIRKKTDFSSLPSKPRPQRPHHYNNYCDDDYDDMEYRTSFQYNHPDYLCKDHCYETNYHDNRRTREEFPMKIYDSRRVNNYDRHNCRESHFNHFDRHHLMNDIVSHDTCNAMEYSLPLRFDCAPCMPPSQRSHESIIRHKLPPIDNYLDYLPPRHLPPSNLGVNTLPNMPAIPHKALLPHDLTEQTPLNDLPYDIPRKENKILRDRKKTKNETPSVRTLQKLYDISPYELEKIRKLFNHHAGIDKRLNFQEFIQLYGILNPQSRGPQIINIAENAFISNDLDNDGFIKFEEFLVAYCLTKPMSNVGCNTCGHLQPEVICEEFCTPF